MFVNSDFSDLLKHLIANSVVYLVIGDNALIFIFRHDLMITKRASGRPQDLIDADLLSQSPDS